MTGHPNTSRGDVAYWGLTHAQAAGYHARLSQMYADRTERLAAGAVRQTRRATIGNRVVMALAGIAIILAVVSLVTAA